MTKMRAVVTALGSVLTSAILLASPAAADPPVGTIVPPIEGYVWGWLPAAASYYSATGYEYNAAGAAVQVLRSGVGTYQVRFINMAGQGGVAHVSAYGASNICTVASWGPSLGDEIVNVRCYSAAGAATDSRFIAHVTNRTDGASRGYLWSNDATPPLGGYTPSATYSYDSTDQAIAVFGEDTGSYAVELGAFGQDIGGRSCSTSASSPNRPGSFQTTMCDPSGGSQPSHQSWACPTYSSRPCSSRPAGRATRSPQPWSRCFGLLGLQIFDACAT